MPATEFPPSGDGRRYILLIHCKPKRASTSSGLTRTIPGLHRPDFRVKGDIRVSQKFKIPLILFLMLGSGMVTAQITISNSSGSTIAYISSEGTIENSGRSTIGYIDSSGRVENSGRSTIGYVSDDRVEDGGRSTIGYIDSGGRIEDGGRSTIAYIESDRVENAGRSTILRFSGDRDLKAIAAYLFFFSDALK